MALPNPGMSFSPFAILTAAEMNDLVENIEALANGTGLANGAVTPAIQGDSGWITPTYNAAYDAGSTAQYRKIGGVVYLRGAGIRDTGTPTSADVIFTLPSGYRPSIDYPQVAGGTSTNIGKINIISSSGDVTVATTATGGGYLLLNGFNFTVT